ncbi:MAG TPA: sigma-70 family RNA polymerase sigma factor [Mariprofundaceae bacterium]|nr:sigma-70 family RNA polymerase sigma factor [Mariprofundaceae bacterium]
MKCVIRAWHQHEGELRRWLIATLGNPNDAEDLLQDVFEKAMLQGERFCSLDSPRAWLFCVAKNALIDRYRLKREHIELPENMPVEEKQSDAVDDLSECLPRVLSELSQEDREAITLCDLNGMKQLDYAELKGLSLPAAKSRLQRARKKLRTTLEQNCKVRLSEAGKVCCFVPRPPLK